MRVPKEVVVEEEEVASGQPLDLGEGLVHRLGVEGFAALEEGFFVAEIAGVRAAARDHDAVGHQVEAAPDQVAAWAGRAGQAALGRAIDRVRAPGAEIREKQRPRVLAWAQENRVSVLGGLLRQCRDVQAPEGNVGTPAAVVIGKLVGAVSRGDVDLNRDKVRGVLQVERLDVLVFQRHLIVIAEVARQRRQTQGREERVLDGSPIWALGLGQRR